MKSVKKLYVCVLAALFYSVAVAAAGQAYDKNAGDDKPVDEAPPSYVQHGNCEFDPAKMLEGVNLADEQKAQIEGIAKVNDDLIKKAEEKTRAEKAKVYELLKSEAAVEILHTSNKELQAVRGELAEICLDYMLAIRTTLTPEQRVQLKMPSDEPVILPKSESSGEGKIPRAGGRGRAGRGKGSRGGW